MPFNQTSFKKGHIVSLETRRKMSKSKIGKKLTDKTIQKIKNSKLFEKNPNWKGDKVQKTPLHLWIKRHKFKVELCEICNKNPSYDLANISGKYKRDINDFKWLCRSCHMKEDGRINNLKQYRGKI